MKNRRISVMVILLVIALATYFGVIANGTTRAVEFLAIFVIGTLFGVLLMQLFKK